MLRAVALAMLITPGLSHAGTPGEEDAITINRLTPQNFEVVAGSFTATAEYFWCGAASYIERRRGQSAQTAIFIKRPIGSSRNAGRRKSVIFTTSGAGLPKPPAGLTLNISDAGATMKSYKARQYCRDAFTRSTK